MESLAGERVEEPGGVADQQPARAGAARHAMTERRGAGERVGRRASRQGAGSPSVAGTAATIESATAGAMRRAPPPERPSTIPTLTRHRHRRDPEVPVARTLIRASRHASGRVGQVE